MDAVEVSLNGKKVSARPGMSILELATEHGVRIPTLCHHPELRPAGACRVCLVEEETRGNLVAACTTPVAQGMKIATNSPRANAARKFVVELMLAAHPDSCIVCDKGNRCELRRLAGELGIGEIGLEKFRKFQPIESANEFIERDLSKCILCGKCVRACQEIQVIGAIDYAFRGFASKPATNLDRPLELSSCTFCGLCLDICPVGALSEKSTRGAGRWTSKARTVCPWCDVGCNINLHARGDKVITVSPAAGGVNGSGLCAKGRFGFDFVNHPGRLTAPLVRRGEDFVEATWEEALGAAARGLMAVRDELGPDAVGAIGSTRFANEDAYALQRFARQVLGTNNVDCGWNGSFSGVGYIGRSSAAFDDIDKASAVFAIGDSSNHPVLEARIRRAVRDNGCRLYLVAGSKGLAPFATRTFAAEEARMGDLAASAQGEERPLFVVFSSGGQAARAVGEALDVAKSLGVGVIALSGPNNARGAYDMGLTPRFLPGCAPVSSAESRGAFEGAWNCALPDRPGLGVLEMIGGRSGLAALFVAGSNPALYVPESEANLRSLKFLVVQELFMTETARLADVVLPAASFAEKDGTFTNAEGRVQAIRRAIEPIGSSRADWEIIAALAAAMDVDFGYGAAGDITREISNLVRAYSGARPESLEKGVFVAYAAGPESRDGGPISRSFSPADGAMLAHSRVARFLAKG